MTVPMERTNAVLNTEKFLLDLLRPSVTPRVPKEIRERARGLLRHYPSSFDMDVISEREDSCPSVLTEQPIMKHKVFGKGYK